MSSPFDHAPHAPAIDWRNVMYLADRPAFYPMTHTRVALRAMNAVGNIELARAEDADVEVELVRAVMGKLWPDELGDSLFDPKQWIISSEGER